MSIENLSTHDQAALKRIMSAMGKRGGPKGGKARMKLLTAKGRKELGRKAARARWSKRKPV